MFGFSPITLIVIAVIILLVRRARKSKISGKINTKRKINSNGFNEQHHTVINPASGLPMVNKNMTGMDIGGNPYGFNDSSFDGSSFDHDDF